MCKSQATEDCYISAAVLPISTKFGMMMQFDPLTVPTVKNIKFQKSKMAAAAILKNRKIAISATVSVI